MLKNAIACALGAALSFLGTLGFAEGAPPSHQSRAPIHRQSTSNEVEKDGQTNQDRLTRLSTRKTDCSIESSKASAEGAERGDARSVTPRGAAVPDNHTSGSRGRAHAWSRAARRRKKLLSSGSNFPNRKPVKVAT